MKKQKKINPNIVDLKTEWKYLVDSSRFLSAEEQGVLHFILSETFDPRGFGESTLIGNDDMDFLAGPKISLTSPWSNCMTRICNRSGLDSITRLERLRHLIPVLVEGETLTSEQEKQFADLVHDFMVEELYPPELESFDLNIEPKAAKFIPVLEKRLPALRQANKDLGANLSDFSLKRIAKLCRKYRRNPTDMFLFEAAQSLGEHSRHPHFNRLHEIDGVIKPFTMMEIIQRTVIGNERNSISNFKDNSSVISGHDTLALVRDNPLGPSVFQPTHVRYEITFNGETHNYPTAVKAFPGAETGTGGRIRDNIMTGRGGMIIAGGTAYLVGFLNIEGYKLPWEIEFGPAPQGLELPVDILIGASNGASDYGNKVGEPVIQGSARSFEAMIDDEWYGYRKCIMFTNGIGQIRSEHVEKGEPKAARVVVRFGGDSLPVGVGGGSRSSDIIKQAIQEKIFDEAGVQRGNAWMENLGVQVIRGCCDLGEKNPNEVAHDSGAGGMSNVGPEIVYACGGWFFMRRVPMGDKSMSDMVYWTNESQEVNLVLVKPEKLHIFLAICEREGCPVQVVGFTTGDGEFTLYDEMRDTKPIQFNMKDFFGEDQKPEVKKLTSIPLQTNPFRLPQGLTVKNALDRVLRLVDVSSKRFLTTKVDRSVTGQIAQQQTVGPCQLPLADVAIVTNSMLAKTGAAMALGEQPIYGLTKNGMGPMVRMSIVESLLNMAAAKIDDYHKIFFCGNWMWAAKLPGEGVRLFNAVEEVTKYVCSIGLGINTGKDSLGMAVQTMVEKIIKMIISPGTFMASAYTPMSNVTQKVTPDFKKPGKTRIGFLDLRTVKEPRMGGSVLGRVYNQIGTNAPDMKNGKLLVNAFKFIQELIDRELIYSYHDRSDGGLIVTLLEMAFAGNCGFEVKLKGKDSRDLTALKLLFNQEAGCAFECEKWRAIRSIARKYGLNKYLHLIGQTIREKQVAVSLNSHIVLDEDMRVLRDTWEETAFMLEKRQANPETVAEERKAIYDRPGMNYKVTYNWRLKRRPVHVEQHKPRVAILRDEGSNSQWEMASAWQLAGWEPWDVHVTDLMKGYARLSIYNALASVGGFTYGDVGDAGKGMASVTRYNKVASYELERFLRRPDTITFNVCNGNQWSTLNGIVPWRGIPLESQPRFIWGRSHRFESRLVLTKILRSDNIFLRGMAGSVLPVWHANGEGKAFFPDKDILAEVLKQDLAPVRYVDDDHKITMRYPFNPTGSTRAIAALGSGGERRDRDLSIMPHPERSVLMWQWAFVPWSWRNRYLASPWIKLFQNATEWYYKLEEDLSREPSIEHRALAA